MQGSNNVFETTTQTRDRKLLSWKAQTQARLDKWDQTCCCLARLRPCALAGAVYCCHARLKHGHSLTGVEALAGATWESKPGGTSLLLGSFAGAAWQGAPCMRSFTQAAHGAEMQKQREH